MDSVWHVKDTLNQSLTNETIKKLLVLNNQFEEFDNREQVKIY
jgi:hypothetical protein